MEHWLAIIMAFTKLELKPYYLISPHLSSLISCLKVRLWALDWVRFSKLAGRLLASWLGTYWIDQAME